jgi:hypothetical protein
MRTSMVAGFLAITALTPAYAPAQEARLAAPALAPVHDSLGVGVNPLGLQNALDVDWSWRLSGSRRPLLQDAHVRVGLGDRLSPAYNRLGAFAEIAPLSVLDLQAGVEPVLYFGTFNALFGFRGYDAPFGSDALEARRAHGDASAGLAARAYVGPTLKARLRHVVARAHADFEWWRSQRPGGMAFFYEPTRDTLLDARGDRMVCAEALALYEISDRHGWRLLAGPMYTLTRVWRAPENQKQDLGLLAMIGLGAKRLGAHDPTLLTRVFYYLQDPHRRGQVGAQVAVGFGLGK